MRICKNLKVIAFNRVNLETMLRLLEIINKNKKLNFNDNKNIQYKKHLY